MENQNKQALLEAGLTRAAEKLGDITAPVLTHFYERFPDAVATFDQLWPGRRAALEGEMVERVIYCVMGWFEFPGEIEIMLLGSVPHHAQTLKVPPQWYGGLMEAVAETIVAEVPAERTDELAVWGELRAELLNLVRMGGAA